MWFWRRFFFTFSVLTVSFGDSDLTRTRTSLDSDLSWTRQRWTWLQPYYMNILICIQLCEYTDLYTRAWHNTRLMQDHVAAISFTLITIVAIKTCVCTSVTLASLSSESCSLLIQLFWATIQSVFTHDEKHVLLRNTEYVERWYC